MSCVSKSLQNKSCKVWKRWRKACWHHIMSMDLYVNVQYVCACVILLFLNPCFVLWLQTARMYLLAEGPPPPRSDISILGRWGKKKKKAKKSLLPWQRQVTAWWKVWWHYKTASGMRREERGGGDLKRGVNWLDTHIRRVTQMLVTSFIHIHKLPRGPLRYLKRWRVIQRTHMQTHKHENRCSLTLV